ncbi:MAG: hypothetical protein FGM39_11750, partial [Phycisphaerales bacterium]|nr:hypothetical protein [Phycisphaerales bacterium]
MVAGVRWAPGARAVRGRGPTLPGVRVAIVSNASAGRGRARHARAGVRAALARAGIDAVDLALDGPWDEAVDRMRAVIAVGGDGTVRAVAGRLAGRRVPLAIVPVGTENLAARAFGFRLGADRLAAAVRDGSVRHVDLGVIRRPGLPEHRFVVMASAGFDADVVAALHAARRGPISHASYLGPIVRTAWRWRAPEVAARGTGGAAPLRWHGGVVVANAREYALRLDPAGEADPADGQLDAVALRCRSVLGVIGWFARLAVAGPGRAAGLGRDRAWHVRWDRPVHLQADG